jgi:DNA-binding transcriptional LysR family regulator
MRYFAAAARHEHLGRAADELDMSQPALGRSILKLRLQNNLSASRTQLESA